MKKDNKPFSVPILFIIFNRPDTTTRVFETIRKIKPAKLYVAADGPRVHKEEE
ncbi:MAG: glycosyltransferase family 2 protein, partial [Minisyncoccia bacterium]